jgi:hypothetical protein
VSTLTREDHDIDRYTTHNLSLNTVAGKLGRNAFFFRDDRSGERSLQIKSWRRWREDIVFRVLRDGPRVPPHTYTREARLSNADRRSW